MPLPYKSSLSDSIRNREYDISSALPSNLDFSTSGSSLSSFQQLLQQPEDSQLYGRELGNMWDAVGSAAWGYGDMATFHILRAFTDGQPLAKAIGEKYTGIDTSTTAGYFGEQLGSAFGFLTPMKVMQKGIGWGITRTGIGAKTIANKLSKESADILTRKSAVKFAANKDSVAAKGKTAGEHLYEAVNDRFVKRWHNPANKAMPDGIHSAFHSATDKTKFVNSVTNNMAKSLDDLAKATGTVINNPKVVSKEMTEIFSKYFSDARKMPVARMSEYINARLGLDSKTTRIMSNMFEEAVTFSVFEGLLEGVNAMNEGRESHMLKHGWDSAKLGAILGFVRHIPGGSKLSPTLFGAGKGSAIGKTRQMFQDTRPFAGRLDPRIEGDRIASFKLFKYLTEGNPFRGKNKVGDMMTDFADRHPLSKMLKGKKKKGKDVSIGDFTSSSINDVLMHGSPKQKDAMGQIMIDTLDDIRKTYRKEFFPQMWKEIKEDLKGSLPRMMAGGIAMSGGPSIFFDENIPIDDKIFSLALGAFFMKKGHEVTTTRKTEVKGRTQTVFVEPSGFIGGKQRGFYSTVTERLNQDITKMGQNPWAWGGWNQINLGGSTNLNIVENLGLSSSEFGKRLRRPYEASQKDIVTNKELKVYEARKNDPGEVAEGTYESYVQAISSELPAEGNIRGWNNLSSKQKRNITKKLIKEGFKSPEDVLEAKMLDNMEILETGDAVLLQGLTDVVRTLNIERGRDSTGMITLPKLNPQGNNKAEVLEQINNYNGWLEILRKSGKVKTDGREEVGIGEAIVTEGARADKFTEEMTRVHSRVNELYGNSVENGYELNPNNSITRDFYRVKTYFQNKINSKRLLDILFGRKEVPDSYSQLRRERLDEAKNLITNIFNPADLWVGKIKLNTHKNSRNQIFVNNLNFFAEQFSKTPSKIQGDYTKETTYKNLDNITFLRDVFKSEGVNILEKRSHLAKIFKREMELDLFHNRINNGGQWSADGKRKIPLTEESKATVLTLGEMGFLDVKSMTMPKWGKFEDSLSKVSSGSPELLGKLSDLFIQGGQQNIERFVKDFKEIGKSVGKDTSVITVERVKEYSDKMNELIGQLAGRPGWGQTREDVVRQIKGDMTFVFKEMQDRVQPLMADIKNGTSAGFIKVNNQETLHLTPEGLMMMKAKMHELKYRTINQDMTTFLNELATVSISPDKRLQGFSNFLIKNIARDNWKRTDSIKLLEMASAHRIYDPIERKFKTQDMKNLDLHDAMRKILASYTRGTSESSDRIEGWMKSIEAEVEASRAGAEYKTVRLDKLLEKYDFSNARFGGADYIHLSDAQTQIHYNSIGGAESPSAQARKIYDNFYGDKKQSEWVNDMVDAAMRNHNPSMFHRFVTGAKPKSVDKAELVRELNKVVLDIQNGLKMSTIHYNEFNQSWTTSTDITTKRNIQTESIAEALGDVVVAGEKKHFNFSIVPEQFMGSKKVWDRNLNKNVMKPSHKVLSESVEHSGGNVTYPNEALINEALFTNKITFDKKAERDNITGEFKETPDALDRMILYMPGVQKYGYAIPATEAKMYDAMRVFVEKIADKQYKIPKELQSEWLENLGIVEKQVEGKKEYDLDMTTLNSSEGAALWFKRVLDVTEGLNVFGKNYAEQRFDKLEGEGSGDLLRRAMQWSNAKANQLSDNYLKGVVDVYEKQFDFNRASQKHYGDDVSFFKNLVKGNERVAVLRDEKVGDTFDILDGYKKEIAKDYQGVAGVNEYIAEIQRNVNRFKEDVSSRPSSQDAGTIIPDWKFDALARLYNVDVREMAGGFKPIMFRGGNDWFISKTAFTKNSDYNEFFRNNPNIFGITFTSATKSVAGKRSKFLEDYIIDTATDIKGDWHKHKFTDDRMLMPLTSSDIRLNFAKGYKNESTISPNQFVGLSETTSDKVYRYYFSDKVSKNLTEMSRLHDINNFEKAIARNKQWTKETVDETSFEWYNESPLAAENLMAESNVIPYLSHNSKAWSKHINANFIQPVIRPKEPGSQFVHQGSHPEHKLENSVHVWENGRAVIHNLGEVKLGWGEQFKSYDKQNTFFVKNKSKKERVTSDDLMSFNQLLKEIAKTDPVLSKNIKLTNTIGEINDILPMEYQQVALYKRDPVVSTDSVIPVRIHRKFKDKRDGNSGQINEMDGQLSAEMDNDIDIGNVWWNGPRSYFKEVMQMKGNVPWGNADPNKSSMHGIRDVWNKDYLESHSNYRGILKESDKLKGQLMNYQGILEWLWRYNGGQMQVGKEGQQGFQIGKNFFASIRSGTEEKRTIQQNLRNAIQGIVDGVSGFNYAKYKKFENEFLFDGDMSVFSTHYVDKNEWKPSKISASTGAREAILRTLIQPYRALKGITSGVWEGSRRKQATYDELIAAVWHYDSQLKNADKYARKIIKGKGGGDIESVFNGWNFEAVLSGATNGKTYDKMLVHDRLLLSISGMDYRKMINPPRGTKNPYEYSDNLETLIHSKNTADMMRQYNNMFKDFQSKQEFIKHLELKKDSLSKLAGKISLTNKREALDLWKKVNKIQRIVDSVIKDSTFKFKTNQKGKLTFQQWDSKANKFVNSKKQGKEFKVLWEKIKDNRREELKAEWLKNVRPGTEAYEKSLEGWNKANDKDKKVLETIEKKGLTIDHFPDHDVLSAMAAHDAIGLLAHRKPSQLNLRPNVVEATYRELFNEVDSFSKKYSNEYKKVHEGKSDYTEETLPKAMKDRMTHLYEKYHNAYGEEVAMQVLWQFAAPKFDKSRLVSTGHKMWFAPTSKYYGGKYSFVKNWIAQTDLIKNDVKRMIFNELGSAENRSFLAFYGKSRGENDLFTSGEDIMVRKDDGSLVRKTKNGLLDVRGQFKDNPLDYGSESTVKDMLSEIHPGFEGMSATGSYSEMLKLMGSGNIPQIMSLHKSYFIPSAAVSEVSRFASHMSTNGYSAFQKVRNEGITAYLEKGSGKSTLDPDGTFRSVEPFDNFRREKDILEEIRDSYAERMCNQGNK